MMYSFADEKTGRFAKKRVSCREGLIALNTHAGYIAVEGDHDYRTRRLDVAALAASSGSAKDHVVDYERPAEEVEAERVAAADSAAQRDINDLELRSLRTIREAVIKLLPDGEDKDRLLAIDEAVAASRQGIAPARLEP